MLSSLEADRVRVADFDSEVQDLLASVSAHQAVAQKLDSQYPVLTLPNEVIGEIFLHFVPAYPLCPPFFGTCSPIILTQICHVWREIALSTPALWRAIPLTRAENRVTFQARGRIHRCNTWLRRSGCRPLSIDIDDSCAAELLAAVTPHSSRWEYLKLHDTRWYDPWQPTVLEGPMPSLRHLDLQICLPETDVLTLGEVPLLRSVTLELEVLVLTNVVLPWAQLTSLTLPAVAPLECVPLLQQATNLVHCTLGLCFSQDGTGNDLPELTLPFLESLTLIRKTGAADLDLDTFIVPALRRLETSLLAPSISDLESFIAKSGCKLQEVCITGDRYLSPAKYHEGFPSIRFSFKSEYGLQIL